MNSGGNDRPRQKGKQRQHLVPEGKPRLEEENEEGRSSGGGGEGTRRTWGVGRSLWLPLPLCEGWMGLGG